MLKDVGHRVLDFCQLLNPFYQDVQKIPLVAGHHFLTANHFVSPTNLRVFCHFPICYLPCLLADFC